LATFAAGAGLLGAVGFATGAAFGAGFAAALGEVFGAAAFAVVGLEAATFSAAFAVFFSISLLLFLEDFAADGLTVDGFEVARVVLTDTRVRLLDALRLVVDDLPVLLEILFLRVFCDTACARKTPRPCRKNFPRRTHQGLKGGANRVRLAEYPYK
jgi:hypothetical protein